MDFVAELYNELQSFPADEKFGIISQLRRAAVSITSNSAEGAARKKYQGIASVPVYRERFVERDRYAIRDMLSGGLPGKDCLWTFCKQTGEI